MSTQTVTPSVRKPLVYKTVSIASERKVGQRGGDKAAIKAAAVALFNQGGFAYQGALPLDAREALADKLEIALPDLGINLLSQENPDAVKCVACRQVHKLHDPDLSAKITFYSKNGKTYPLSDSCRDEIIGRLGNATKVLTKETIATYRTDFPAPVAR